MVCMTTTLCSGCKCSRSHGRDVSTCTIGGRPQAKQEHKHSQGRDMRWCTWSSLSTSSPSSSTSWYCSGVSTSPILCGRFLQQALRSAKCCLELACRPGQARQALHSTAPTADSLAVTVTCALLARHPHELLSREHKASPASMHWVGSVSEANKGAAMWCKPGRALVVGLGGWLHEVKAAIGARARPEGPHGGKDVVCLQGQVLQALPLILLQECLHRQGVLVRRIHLYKHCCDAAKRSR